MIKADIRNGRHRQTKLTILALAGAALALLQTTSVLRADATWDGDSAVGKPGDGINWSDANNWTVDGVADSTPSNSSPGDNLTFGGGTVGVIDLGSTTRYANSITFNAGFTLGAAGSTTELNLNSNITVNQGISATISAPIFAFGGLALYGGGTLALAGNNNFGTNGIYIYNGTLVTAGSNALGASPIQIDSTGTLEINSSSNFPGSISNLSGNVNVNASATVEGYVSTGGNFTIAAGQTLTSNGTFSLTGGTLTLNGNLYLQGQEFNDNGGTLAGNGAVILASDNGTPSIQFSAITPVVGTFNFIGTTTSTSTYYEANIDGSTDAAGTTINIDPSNPTTLGQFTLHFGEGFINAGTINVFASNLNHAINFGDNGQNFTNAGTININPGPTADGGRTIDLNITNSGTFNINASTTYEAPITNTGTFTIAAGKTLAGVQTYSSAFTQSAGTLNINGNLIVNSHEFDDNGGTITGTVTLASDNGSPTLSFGNKPATGGTFNFVDGINSDNSYYTAYISGSIPSGVTVNVDPSNSGQLTTLQMEFESYPFTNVGTLNFLATNLNHNIVVEGTLSNTGTVNINPGPTADGGRTFEGQIINSSGTLNINAATALTEGFSNGGTMNVNANTEVSNEDSNNSGNLTIAAGVTLGHTTSNTGSINFTQSGGTLAIDGNLVLTNGTFYDNGGAITGPVTLMAYGTSILSFSPNPAIGGTFNFDAPDSEQFPDFDIQQNVPATATINIAPSASILVANVLVELENTSINAGTINLSATGQNHNITLSGSSLTNSGTININPGPTADGTRLLQLSLSNSGTLNVNASTTFSQSMTNTGNLTIAAGKTLANSQSANFTQSGGTLAVNGNLVLTNGTFYDNGGAITGPVTLMAYGTSILSFGPNPATGGTFNFDAPDSEQYPDFDIQQNVPASATINIAPSASILVANVSVELENTSINAGTINLAASGQPHNIAVTTSTGSLANTGSINSNPGSAPGGQRTLHFQLTNSGSVNINTDSSVDSIVNSGSVTIAAGATLNTGSFGQSAGTLDINGTLEIHDGPFTDIGGDITGAVTLASTFGTPTLNLNDPLSTATFDFIGNASIAAGPAAASVSPIPAGVTVNVEPSNSNQPITMDLTLSGANAGTLNLLALNQNSGISIFSPVTNTGTININPGPTADGTRFFNSLTNSGTINVNASTTFNNMHNTGSVTVAAGKSLGAGNSFFFQSAGTLIVDGSMTAQTLTLGGGTLNIAGSASFGTILPGSNPSIINIPGGVLSLSSYNQSGVSLLLNGLSITSGGQLDVTNNTLILNFTDPSLLAAAEQYLTAGYAAGAWDGAGIISSIAADQPDLATSLGYIVTSPTSLRIMYTWLGDTDLTGSVDIVDLRNMAPVGTTNATWSNGDFNYDGVVNADDYSLFMLGLSKSSGVNIYATLPEPSLLLASAFWIVTSRLQRRR